MSTGYDKSNLMNWNLYKFLREISEKYLRDENKEHKDNSKSILINNEDKNLIEVSLLKINWDEWNTFKESNQHENTQTNVILQQSFSKDNVKNDNLNIF